MGMYKLLLLLLLILSLPHTTSTPTPTPTPTSTRINVLPVLISSVPMDGNAGKHLLHRNGATIVFIITNLTDVSMDSFHCIHSMDCSVCWRSMDYMQCYRVIPS